LIVREGVIETMIGGRNNVRRKHFLMALWMQAAVKLVKSVSGQNSIEAAVDRGTRNTFVKLDEM